MQVELLQMLDTGERGLAAGYAAASIHGAYTTFSTWALEAHRLGEDGRTRLGLANLLVSLALGIAIARIGHEVGTAL